jgi:S1-C subfamily serine protease
MRVECPHCNARVRLDDPPEDDTPIKCPECRKKFAPPEPDDDDRPRRRKKKDRDAEKPVFTTAHWAIAGGVIAAALVGGGIVVAMTWGDGKPKAAAKAPEVAANNPPDRTPPRVGVELTPPVVRDTRQPTGTPQPAPDPDDGETKKPKPVAEDPVQAQLPGGPVVPPQHADLFRAPVSAPPPTIRAAQLRPAAAEIVPEIPTFHSLLLARKTAPAATAVVPKGAKLGLDELKRACAYIKVEAGNLSGTGSGFLISSDPGGALVATNYHVIEAAAAPKFGAGTNKVTAVFNSGQPDEKALKATIVAFDPVADLAVLRVEGGGPWPKALNPYHALPKVVEGTPVQFWGFPLGEILASGKRNPEITLGTGTVSSLRRTASGKLDRVQISGTMNPGNSGGPLVDTDGRLVGVAVSIVNPKLGTGIGFAVPVDDLIALLEGRLLTTIFVPTGLENGRAKFLVFVPIMDPLERVETVFVRRWAGAGSPPEAVKDAATGFRPFGMRKDGKANLPGVDEFPLKTFRTEGGAATGLSIALGEMTVPLDAAQVQIQVASQTVPNLQTGAKLTAASKPVAYTLAVADQPVGSDARPFTDLTANPDALAGKVVVVKARVAAPPNNWDAVQDLIVVGLDGRRPDRMKFLVDRAAAAEFDEVVPEHQPMPVRLVCAVGRRGADGVVPVRVARLDFIGRGDAVVRTIPGPAAAEDKLAALNRDLPRFAGQTVEMKVSAVPLSPQLVQGELMVVFPSRYDPRNLRFMMSTSMRQRLLEAIGTGMRPGTIVPVRVTAVVPTRVAPGAPRTPLTLTKVEFLDEDGNPSRTIE